MTSTSSSPVASVFKEQAYKFTGHSYISVGSCLNSHLDSLVQQTKKGGSDSQNLGFSVSAWFYLHQEFNGHAGGHIAAQGGGWDMPGWSIFYYSNQLRFEFQVPGNKITHDIPFASNSGTSKRWVHVTLSVQYLPSTKTSKMIVFIDGKQAASLMMNMLLTSTAPHIDMRIGGNNTGNNEEHAFLFKGNIAYVKVMNKPVLSEKLVKVVMVSDILDREELAQENNDVKELFASYMHEWPLTKDSYDSKKKSLADSKGTNNGTEIIIQRSSVTNSNFLEMEFPWMTVLQQFTEDVQPENSSLSSGLLGLFDDELTSDLLVLLPSSRLLQSYKFPKVANFLIHEEEQTATSITSVSSELSAQKCHKFRAHKIILSARSPVLKSLIEQCITLSPEAPQYKVLSLQDIIPVHHDHFSIFLKYLYSDKLFSEVEAQRLTEYEADPAATILSLLYLAVHFQVPSMVAALTPYCNRYLLRTDTAALVLELLASTDDKVLTVTFNKFVHQKSKIIALAEEQNTRS